MRRKELNMGDLRSRAYQAADEPALCRTTEDSF